MAVSFLFVTLATKTGRYDTVNLPLNVIRGLTPLKHSTKISIGSTVVLRTVCSKIMDSHPSTLKMLKQDQFCLFWNAPSDLEAQHSCMLVLLSDKAVCLWQIYFQSSLGVTAVKEREYNGDRVHLYCHYQTKWRGFDEHYWLSMSL